MPTASRPELIRKVLRRLVIALGVVNLAGLLVAAPAGADFAPWFANSVGGATQVLAVTGRRRIGRQA